MKKFWVLVTALLVVSMSAVAQTATVEAAGEDMAQAVRENPVNLAEYVDTGFKYFTDIITRLWETGKPVFIFDEGEGQTGLAVTAIENIFMDRANAIIGWTFQNDEPGQFFWGVEVDVDLSGTLGEIFSKFKPAFYVVDGKFLWGFGFELRSE